MFKRCWKLWYSMRVSLHSLLKAILRGRPGCQKNEKSMLGGEKLSDRRKAKTLELNRAAWSAPTESRRANRALIVRGRHRSDLLSVAPHFRLIHGPPFIQSYEEHAVLLLYLEVAPTWKNRKSMPTFLKTKCPPLIW